jgi:hypothetical protein
MRHHVFWIPEADIKLQKLIGEAEDSQAIKRTASEIDHWLSRDPQEFGESRYENVRVAFIRPIAVQFEVLEDHPTVIVLDVWYVSPHR